MTLYHYVRTKDELLTLVTDTVMAEVVLPADQLPDDWRGAMTAIANSSRAALSDIPWVFDIVDDPAIGPNGVRHFDQSLQAVESLPGTLADKLDVIFVVDEYVFGHVLHARNDYTDRGEQPDDDAALMRYVQELTSSGEYPQLAALIAEHGLEPTLDDDLRARSRRDSLRPQPRPPARRHRPRSRSLRNEHRHARRRG